MRCSRLPDETVIHRYLFNVKAVGNLIGKRTIFHV